MPTIHLDSPDTATPVQIDGEISRLLSEIRAREIQLDNSLRNIAHKQSLHLPLPGFGANYDASDYDEHRAHVRQLASWDIEPKRVAVQTLEHVFAQRGGWTRWFLIDGGHLHYDVSTWRCSRTAASAVNHYWMTEYSGLSADEMIELAGDRVCTTCFPNAPVGPFRRPSKPRFMTLSEAERAAYTEAKERKAIAAKAAQITAPDGSELRTANGVHGDLIKTEAAARRRALADASDIAFYGNDHPDAVELRETVDRMIAAIAHRTGETESELRAEINKKVAAKMRRMQSKVLATI